MTQTVISSELDLILLQIQLLTGRSKEGANRELAGIISELRTGNRALDSGVVLKISELAESQTYSDANALELNFLMIDLALLNR